MQGRIALSPKKFPLHQDVSNGRLPESLCTANLVEFGAVLLQRRIAAGLWTVLVLGTSPQIHVV